MPTQKIYLASKVSTFFACLMLFASSPVFADTNALATKLCEATLLASERAQILANKLNDASEMWITFRDDKADRQSRIRVGISNDSVNNGNQGTRPNVVFFSPKIDPSEVSRHGTFVDGGPVPLHYHLMYDHVVGIHDHRYLRPRPAENNERDLLGGAERVWHVREVSFGVLGSFELGREERKEIPLDQRFLQITLSRGPSLPEAVFTYSHHSLYQVYEIEVIAKPVQVNGRPLLPSGPIKREKIFSNGRWTLFDEVIAP